MRRMSDDFGTVNVSRGQRSREIEVMRQHYRHHRENLVKMMADAPTEHLAGEYERLIRDIDSSLVKLDELEGRPVERHKTEPGMRPLVQPPAVAPSPAVAPPVEAALDEDTQVDYIPGADPAPPTPGSGSRVLLIVAGALIVLGIIGWLLWRASSDRSATPAITETAPVTETEAVTTQETNTGTVVPVATPEATTLAVKPATHDYGVIRKGTRAVRQFELTNRGDEPLTISVARSSCRCLYYEYGNGVVPAKGKSTVTVTIDGGKAKAGPLQESLAVRAKGEPEPVATLKIAATIE